MMRTTNVTIPGNIVPDSLDWALYDQNGLMLVNGTTTEITGAPTNRGMRLLIYYQTGALPPGTYELTITTGSDYGDREYQSTVEVEAEADPHAPIVTRKPVFHVAIPPHILDDEMTIEVYPPASALCGGEPIVDEMGIPADALQSLKALVELPVIQGLDNNGVYQYTWDAYSVIIKSDMGSFAYQVYYVNVPMAMAIQDMRVYLDRLNRQLRLDQLEMSDGDYAWMLAAGRDRWNSIPYLTTFSMTNAVGPLRHFWMTASRVVALRIKYLEEGLSSFQYMSQSATLDVDVTQYLESLASTLESELEQSRELKMILAKRGVTNGTGCESLDNRILGTVGLSIFPQRGLVNR